MTHARVQYRINQDETLQVEVEWACDAPDAPDQVAARARKLFADTLADLFHVTRITGDAP